jgi:hypothetical protein
MLLLGLHPQPQATPLRPRNNRFRQVPSSEQQGFAQDTFGATAWLADRAEQAGKDERWPLVGPAADLQHRKAAMASSENPPQFVTLQHWISKVRWSVRVMSVIGEILAKCFAIGIVAAGAFVITTYALSNNWL